LHWHAYISPLSCPHLSKHLFRLCRAVAPHVKLQICLVSEVYGRRSIKLTLKIWKVHRFVIKSCHNQLPDLLICLIEIAHSVIDLLIQGAQNPTASTSPSTPSSPHPLRNSAATNPQPVPVPYKPDQLMRMKIAMRETEHPPRPRESVGYRDLQIEAEAMMLGRNEGTVRFLFAPPGFGMTV
jgi:hypothetical protein